jgi:alpha-beta hydrolase superfamily lysophospholipase
VHHGGAGWHSGYFELLGRTLAAEGFACLAYDQVGCGYSDGPAPGFVDCLERVTSDLQKMAEEEQKKYGGKVKVFILGESAGAFKALHHGLERSAKQLPNDPVAGYIFCGPVFKVENEMPHCIQGIVKVIGHFLPWLEMPAVDIASAFDSAFGDPQWVAAGKKDGILRRVLDSPVHFRTASEVLKGFDFVNNKHVQCTFKAPFAIFMGEKEARVDLGAIFDFYMKASSEDKILKVIPNGYHHLFQDQPEVSQQVLQDIISWLHARS